MNFEQLKKLVQLGESDQVEFKKSTGLLSAAFNSVCAFLNGEGGTVLIRKDEQPMRLGCWKVFDAVLWTLVNFSAK